MGSRSPRPDGLRRSVRREKGPPDLFLNPSHPIFRMIVLPGVLFFHAEGGCEITPLVLSGGGHQSSKCRFMTARVI